MIAHPVCRNKIAARKGITREGIPSVSFEDRMSIHFNSDEVKLYALEGSRSAEDILVYLPEAKVLLLGDIIISDSFPVVKVSSGASIKTLIRNLEQILEMFPDDVKLSPSHGREYTMNELRAYHIMIVETYRAVSEQFIKGKTLNELIANDFLGDWKNWDNKKFLHVNRDFWIKTIYEELKT